MAKRDFFLMFDRAELGYRACIISAPQLPDDVSPRRITTMRDHRNALFIAFSLLVAASVVGIAGQANAGATQAPLGVAGIHPQQASSPSPSPSPT
jgi:hypothetical protein